MCDGSKHALSVVIVHTRLLKFTACIFWFMIEHHLKGLLNEKFIQVEELQDHANPNFVEEIVILYYHDSSKLVSNLEHSLERNALDFNKLDPIMYQFKGSSSRHKYVLQHSAKKVKAEYILFRGYCRAGNAEGRSFQQMKKEYTTLCKKLETYFQVSDWLSKLGPSRQHFGPNKELKDESTFDEDKFELQLSKGYANNIG
ncbi:Histidine-containing phosphotransfer protein 4, partial [Mucuna pruriens]